MVRSSYHADRMAAEAGFVEAFGLSDAAKPVPSAHGTSLLATAQAELMFYAVIRGPTHMLNRNLLVFSATAAADAGDRRRAARPRLSRQGRRCHGADRRRRPPPTTLVYGLLSDSRYAYRPLRARRRAVGGHLPPLPRVARQRQAVLHRRPTWTASRRTAPRSTMRSRQQDLKPAYDIFTTYVQRVDERVAYRAQPAEAKPFDFTRQGNAGTTTARRRAWAADQAALNDIWRKSSRTTALRLKLAGRSQDEIRKTLDKRYANLDSRVARTARRRRVPEFHERLRRRRSIRTPAT